MTYSDIVDQIKSKGSFLCIGLDTEFSKIPKHLLSEDDPIYTFNKTIIDATYDLVIAYKPNMAFYESLGVNGWKSLEKTLTYIRSCDKNIYIIADAKRTDIGNTASQYAKAFFETFDFDAVTVTPYMGEDSISPFLAYKNKWVILLALTSNKGASDFQMLETTSNQKLFEEVFFRSRQWGNKENMMYVVGATKSEMLWNVREIIPDHFLLVPGIGVQGGNLEEVVRYGFNDNCGLIVNASRSIIFASSGHDFAEKARDQAMGMKQQMSKELNERNFH